MEINNLEDLKVASTQASELLQKIQNYCEVNDLNWTECEEARVRFPRGFIRPALVQRKRLPFLRNHALKSNLAYTLILSDVVLWIKLRTDISGTAQEMLTKLYVFLVGTLCESITKEYLKDMCGKGFKPRNEFMFTEKIIDGELKNDLDWLWDTRNRMHLFQLEDREYENNYNDSCHVRCVTTYRKLLKALNAHFLSIE